MRCIHKGVEIDDLGHQKADVNSVAVLATASSGSKLHTVFTAGNKKSAMSLTSPAPRCSSSTIRTGGKASYKDRASIATHARRGWAWPLLPSLYAHQSVSGSPKLSRSQPRKKEAMIAAHEKGTGVANLQSAGRGASLHALGRLTTSSLSRVYLLVIGTLLLLRGLSNGLSILLVLVHGPVEDVIVLEAFTDEEVAEDLAEIRVVGLVVEAE